jgi:hypothetical protein
VIVAWEVAGGKQLPRNALQFRTSAKSWRAERFMPLPPHISPPITQPKSNPHHSPPPPGLESESDPRHPGGSRFRSARRVRPSGTRQLLCFFLLLPLGFGGFFAGVAGFGDLVEFVTDRALLFEPCGHRFTGGPGMEGVQGEAGEKSFDLGVI